ncbi:MAG TPA: cysteate synthase [Ktedonobacteraceae bacterium]|jgi:cysteate synthase
MRFQHYRLSCPVCGCTQEDDGFLLECKTENHPAALLESDYFSKRFDPDPSAEGIYRYRQWLPVRRTLRGTSRTITYRSDTLSRITRLPHLWIAFNGYWPEKGAALETATFKELEAYVVLSRLPEDCKKVLVVASAGNTAAAFAWMCSQNKIPCLIVMPTSGLPSMQFAAPLDACVKVVALSGSADYYDAIQFANRISSQEGFLSEGGVKNIARRDGLGTTLLAAVEVIGRLPGYYFQAIGSGSGAIAVHEGARRLIVDGRFGQKLPQQMLSQNLPFAPIYRSWKAGQRELIELSSEEAKGQIRQIVAHVLSNQKPPYSLAGGVFDILTESWGDMLAVENAEALEAIEIFKKAEGITLHPAAGVAFASLLKAAQNGSIDQKQDVLLHITGGWQTGEQDQQRVPAAPALKFDLQEVDLEKALDQILTSFSSGLETQYLNQ